MRKPNGRNRRPLGDIGNITRPVTRGYAKAQVAAAAAAAMTAGTTGTAASGLNNLNTDVELHMAMAKKKVVTVYTKPRDHEIIDISPDTSVKMKCNPKKGGGSSNMKMLSFTEIKVDYSINKKKKEEILDVDSRDMDDQFAVVEYIEDLYLFYRKMEIECQVIDYIKLRPELMMTEEMRAIIVNWLIRAHQKFELTPETLYLTINLMDRYFASQPRTHANEFHLVGIGAMLMASKYEDVWPPEVNDIVSISGGVYTHNQILQMEKRILESLDWNLTVPTPYVFLARFIKVSTSTAVSKKAALLEESMSYFLAEIGMVNYANVLCLPSKIAAASVYAARYTLDVMPTWTETLKFHTGYSEMQLFNCAKMLVGFRLSPENTFNSVYLKYSVPKRASVALYSASEYCKLLLQNFY